MNKIGHLLTVVVAASAAVFCSHAYAESRPLDHFTPHAGWINDPNGTIKLNGSYNLFYQYYNGGWALSDGEYKDPTVWGPMHWGHAISKDLVHWKELPVALAPDERVGTTGVKGMIFSGSAVLDKDNTSGFGSKAKPPLVAIYTLTDTFGAAGGQRQALAYSTDGGTKWTKYAGNPVLPYNNTETFRDPQVLWLDQTHDWRMVVSCGNEVCFYASKDLKNWQKAGTFGSKEVGVGVPWECPDLFPLDVERDGKIQRKWVLVVSVRHGSPSGSFGTRYIVGDFDGTTFTNSDAPTVSKWLDHGSDFYAAKTWQSDSAAYASRAMIAWEANWNYAKTIPAGSYRNQMTLPRDISLKYDRAQGYYLAQKPVKAVVSDFSHDVKTLRFDSKTHLIATNVSGRTLVKIDISGQKLTGRYSAVIAQANGEQLNVDYDADRSTILVKRSGSTGYDFGQDYTPQAAEIAPSHGRIHVDVYFDLHSADAFVNDGRVTFSTLLYPGTDGKH